jgi:hypothetical protein
MGEGPLNGITFKPMVETVKKKKKFTINGKLF